MSEKIIRSIKGLPMCGTCDEYELEPFGALASLAGIRELLIGRRVRVKETGALGRVDYVELGGRTVDVWVVLDGDDNPGSPGDLFWPENLVVA